MQKEIINGVPFWKDKSNNIFSFEIDKKNLLQLGSNAKLFHNWQELYDVKLSSYRDNLKPRDRKENKLK